MTGNALSDHDLEQLSAYLDGELGERERHDLEGRLATDAALRQTLDELRATVELVRSLPPLKAPRSFSLDPRVYGRRAPWWKRILSTGSVLQLAGALGSAASIALIVAALLLNSAQTENDRASQTALQPLPTEVGYIPETAQPPDAASRLDSTPTAGVPAPSALPLADIAQAEDTAAAETLEENAGAAALAGEPPVAEMAPAPETAELFGAAPAAPLAAAQSAPADESAFKEATTEGGPAMEQEAAPMLQADQVEQPAPPSTATVIFPTGTATATQSPTAATLPPTMQPAAVAQEPLSPDDGVRETGPAQDREQDHGRSYTWLAVVGAVLLPVSAAAFVFGRKKAQST